MSYTMQHIKGVQKRPGARKGVEEKTIQIGTFSDNAEGERGVIQVGQMVAWGPEISAAVMTLLTAVDMIERDIYQQVDIP